VFAFVSDGLSDVLPELAQSIAQIGMSILEYYFSVITQRLDLPLNDSQLMGLVGNAVALVNLVGVVRKKGDLFWLLLFLLTFNFSGA
jgi:hypothetical protein